MVRKLLFVVLNKEKSRSPLPFKKQNALKEYTENLEQIVLVKNLSDGVSSA